MRGKPVNIPQKERRYKMIPFYEIDPPPIRMLESGIISPIQPIVTGARIDFTLVAAISGIEQVDYMGQGGYFLKFSIMFQSEHPGVKDLILPCSCNTEHIRGPITRHYKQYEHAHPIEFGKEKEMYYLNIDERVIQLQKVIDHLVIIWELVKIAYHK
jgi:hypothetical protein